MKSNCKLFIFLLMLCQNLYAQQENYLPYTIEKYKDQSSFPIFYSTKDSLVCQKINLYLQLSKLSLLKGKEQKHIFEQNITNEDGTDRNTFDIVKILKNTSKMLSIQFYQTSCGYTCYRGVSYYSFNTSNGNQIFIKDLFHKKQLEEFKKLTLNIREQHLQKEIKELEKEELDEIEAEHMEKIKSCIDFDDVNDFYIQDNILYRDDYNCLDKHLKVAVNLDMITPIHSKEFFHLLNDYGKAVFSQKISQLVGFEETNTYQLFVGTINQKYPITLYLEKGETNKTTKITSISGKYAYNKYGVAIDIEGEIKDNKIMLKEIDKEGEVNAYFELQLKDNQLIGTWKDKTKKKNFAVEARLFPL